MPIGVVKWGCNARLATKRRKIDSELPTLLKLTESAAIISDGQKDEIHPLKAFQCFVVLNLADQQRLDRTKLADLIWPGVEKQNQGDRLRPTLTRLKNELDRLGLTDLLNSNRSQIWLSRRVPTDLDMLLARIIHPGSKSAQTAF
jgi:DNA-binding SARP family transcriptional activator